MFRRCGATLAAVNELARQILELRPGQELLVDGEEKRAQVLRVAKVLRGAGVLRYRVTTRRRSVDGRFSVMAIKG